MYNFDRSGKESTQDNELQCGWLPEIRERDCTCKLQSVSGMTLVYFFALNIYSIHQDRVCCYHSFFSGTSEIHQYAPLGKILQASGGSKNGHSAALAICDPWNMSFSMKRKWSLHGRLPTTLLSWPWLEKLRRIVADRVSRRDNSSRVKQVTVVLQCSSYHVSRGNLFAW